MEQMDTKHDVLDDALSNDVTLYKKRFCYTLIALIVITIIFSAILVILLLSPKKAEDDTKPEPKPSPSPEMVWEELPYPEVYENVACENNEKDINSKFSFNLWNTPKRGDPRWREGFQDMNVLVGYPQLKYNSDLNECTVTVFTKTAIDLNLTYFFDGVEQKSNTKVFKSDYNKALKIKVQAKTGEVLELEEVDFIWNSEKLGPTKYDTNGQKGAIVEMYGWSDKDIEKECEFIGQQGYLGVKVFPHHEQVMSDDAFKDQLNPWYFMYQPVSYSLNGRLGTRDDLRKMIKTCRSKGVRVYADAVVNHMTYNGMDLQKHRFDKDIEPDSYLIGEKYSSGKSPYWTPYKTYEKNPYTKRGTNALEYPGVPYGPMDFHCQKPITDYKDFDNVMYGWLDNLADLNTESKYVRQRIADYLTDLFSIGITGFRIDAAKHMKPVDIAEILALFKKNIGGKFPEDFFTWLEILSGDEADTLFGQDGENSYSWGMNKTLTKLGFSEEDILKVKIWWASYPKNYTCDSGTVDPRRKVIQNDDHDTQYADFRGLGEKGCVLSAGCEAEKHRQFEVKLFKDPYDVENNKDDAPIRMVLSSFYMGEGVAGLPDGKSDCEKYCKNNCDKCKKNSLEYFPAYVENGTAYSGEGFSRVHRDEEIIKAMQEWMEME
jgi:alpha-amylase